MGTEGRIMNNILQKLERVAELVHAKRDVDDDISMMVGEIGELLTLVGRSMQGRDQLEDWVDELADVYLQVHIFATRLNKQLFIKRLNRKIDFVEDVYTTTRE